MSPARARELAVVAGALCLVWIGLAWEVVGSLGDRVVGATNTETWPFLWGHHAMSHALWEEGRWFFRTTMLDHPDGGVLWLKDPLWTALLSPITRTMGAPVAALLEGGALLVLAGVAMFGLCRALGVQALPAAAGALAFAVCPHFLGEAYNGNFEAMAHGWMALWLWAMVAVLQHPGWIRALLAGIGLFLLFVGNQYYFLAMVLASPVLGLAVLSTAQDRWAARVGWAAAGVVLGIVLCVPIIVALRTSIEAPDHLTLLDNTPLPWPPFTTDPMQLVAPFALLSKAPPNPFQDLVYPGWVLVFTTLAGALWRRDRWAVWALAFGTTFLVLSLGPVLLHDGTPVLTDTGAPIALPFYHVQHWHEVLARMTLPHRLAMPAALGWALGLALFVDRLANRSALRTGLALLVVSAAVIELMVIPGYKLPLQSSPADTPAWAQGIAETPLKGGLLNLPSPARNNARAVYLWQQATHGQPLAMSLRVGRLPTVLGVSDPQDRTEAARARRLRDDDPDAIPDDLRARLQAAGFRWVVLQLWLLNRPEEHRPWLAAVEDQMGAGLAFQGAVVVFAVDPDDLDALRTTEACRQSCIDTPDLDAQTPQEWHPPGHGGVTTWAPLSPPKP